MVVSAATGSRVYWSAPFGKQQVPTPGVCAAGNRTTTYPTITCFEDLSSWNEWNDLGHPNNLNGQSQVFVDGTWFVPDTEFTFGGGTAQDQTRAQFVARILNLNGQGTLKMIPDAERTTPIPFVYGALIR
jgi:hypothetical protein